MKIRPRIAIAVAGTALALWAGATVWRASRAIGVAEYAVSEEGHFAFTRTELRRAATGIEQISAPAQFNDAIVFQSRMYAAGPAGLFADGSEYRVGELLPPAPLTAMATCITGDAAAPELWIGTAGEGMLAFDGSSFRQIRPLDAKARKVTAVLGLGTGRVLFGTEKAGVLAYDGGTLNHFHDSVRDIHVSALAGNETDLWVGTLDRGLLHWRAGQASVITGLPDKQVLALASGPDGAVYAGTALGIAIVRNGAVERIVGDGVFARTLMVRGGRLYAGILDAGLYDIPLNGGRPHFIDTTSPVHKLIEAGGELLAASDEGIFQALNGAAVLKRAEAVLADRNISALSMDSMGRLWVGYFDRGLDILEAGFTRARHLEDEHLFCVNRIAQGSSTAVATANGLVLFDPSGQKRQVLGRDQGLIANHVTDIVFQGSEMVAATPAGLSFLAADGVRSLYAFHGLVNNHAYALGLIGGKLMAGTLGGLSVLESGIVRASYTTSNSPLRHNWITAIAGSGEDAFIGTYGAGVVRLGADGSWETFSDMPASTEINPGAMAATASRVYAGTLGKGLLIYDRSDHRWHTVTRGLPSLNVTALHVSNGRVFAGTDNGLVQLP